MTTSFSTSFLRVAVIAGACGACAAAPASQSGWQTAALGSGTQGATVATAAPVLDFIARAAPGESADFEATNDQPRLRVVMGPEYQAASGKVCRRLHVAEGDHPPTTRHACRKEFGVWLLLPGLSNRELDGIDGTRSERL